jgi:hypothetical protein
MGCYFPVTDTKSIGDVRRSRKKHATPLSVRLPHGDCWITHGVGVFFPEPWARFREGVPEADRAGSLVDPYHRLLMNPNPGIHEKAALITPWRFRQH